MCSRPLWGSVSLCGIGARHKSEMKPLPRACELWNLAAHDLTNMLVFKVVSLSSSLFFLHLSSRGIRRVSVLGRLRVLSRGTSTECILHYNFRKHKQVKKLCHLSNTLSHLEIRLTAFLAALEGSC